MTSTHSWDAVDVHPICYFDIDSLPTFPKGHEKLLIFFQLNTFDGCHFVGTRSQKLFAIHWTQLTTPFTPPIIQPVHLHGSAPCCYRSSLRGTTLCAAPSKSYNFSANYQACMAIPTWCRCAPPILFWLWPSFNVFPRSCLTWIFLIDLHWGVPPRVHRPEKAMPFWQIIMYVLQCLHDIHVHLFCFDVELHTFNLFLLRSCVATCPTSNCGLGTSLLWHELVCYAVNYYLLWNLPELSLFGNYSILMWNAFEDTLLRDIVLTMSVCLYMCANILFLGY